jgi:hypothetical protein
MVPLFCLCCMIAWTPAWDIELERDVDMHYFYEDDLFPIVAWNNQQEVCQPNGEWDVPHTYSVAGFTANGIGPVSDSLTVVWPIPEPDGVLMLLAGWVAITGLWWWRSRRG